MQETIKETDGDVRKTGRLMHQMVRTYYQDMMPYCHLSPQEIFDLVKALPYRDDPEDVEALMRPAYTMAGQGYGGDCDDRAIVIASYAVCAGIPYRFVAVRRADMPDFHHVYTELFIGSKWTILDVTYSFNIYGQARARYANERQI
jgi:transglutaminase-like putative cysteine protease